jgi:hypothetical protein
MLLLYVIKYRSIKLHRAESIFEKLVIGLLVNIFRRKKVGRPKFRRPEDRENDIREQN